MQSRRRSGLTSLQDYDYSSTQGMGDQSKFGSRQMESTAGGMRSSVGIYKERLDSPAGGMGGGMVVPKSKGKDLFFQNKVSYSSDRIVFEFSICTLLISRIMYLLRILMYILIFFFLKSLLFLVNFDLFHRHRRHPRNKIGTLSWTSRELKLSHLHLQNHHRACIMIKIIVLL